MATTSVAGLRPDEEAKRARQRVRRSERHEAQAVLWKASGLKRVKSCGHHSVKASGEVSFRVTSGGVTGWAGFSTCGSVWACPVCSEKIAARRQHEVQEAVEAWEALGGSVAFLTLTVRHRVTNSLTAVWDAVADGWRSVTSGRAWKANQRTFGVEGWTRVTEVKHGKNGWHVHLHVLLFLHHSLMGWEIDALHKAAFGRWRIGIAKHGFTAAAERSDLHMVTGDAAAADFGDYFAKGSDYSVAQVAGLEMMRGTLKVGNDGGLTPFQILAQLVRPESVEQAEEAALLWAEFEQGSKGRRQMGWSSGFRAFLKLQTEATDEEVAAQEVGSAADDVVVVCKESVHLVRGRRHLVMTAHETGGMGPVHALLDTLGVRYRAVSRT